LFRTEFGDLALRHDPAGGRDHEQQAEDDQRHGPHPLPADIRCGPVTDQEEQAERRETRGYAGAP
jgi:hypothetical protein